MKMITDDTNSIYVEIDSFKAKFTDTLDVSRLYVIINSDVLNQCQFSYRLCDNLKNNATIGIIMCTGDDYGKWDGNNEFPFTFVAENIPGGPLSIIS